MNIKPKESRWTNAYFEKICDLELGNSLTLPNSKEEVLKYLKFWNRTQLNNSNTIDIVNYEQLIYYEMAYKDDKDIQILIQTIKENIAYNYKIKALLIDNYVDKDLYKEPDARQTNWGSRVGIWG